MPKPKREVIIYNEEQKYRYLNSLNLNSFPPHYWDNFLTKLHSVESIKGKDACNFNKFEIQEMYKYLNYMTFESLFIDNNNLRNYTNWCMTQGLVIDGINHYKDFDGEELMSCVNLQQVHNPILTRDEVLAGIKEVQNDRDRFIILGLFEGIRGKKFEDLVMLRLSDIDGLTAHLYSGKTVEISQTLYDIAKAAVDAEEYNVVRKNPVPMYGGRIIKVLGKRYYAGYDYMNEQNLYRVVERCIDEIGWSDRVSTNSIFVSGAIHMVKELAKQENISSLEVVEDDKLFRKVCDRYDINIVTRRRFYYKYKDLLR